MAGRIVLPPTDPALDANGAPISGSKRYFYANGTTTPKAIYTSAALSTPLPNPSEADAAGRFPDTFGSGSYSVKWVDAAGATIATYDDVLPTENPPFLGVTDGTNAAAGYVGQVISAFTPSSPGVTIGNDVYINVATIPLTPGDWDVEGMGGIVFGSGGATRVIFAVSDISSNPASDNGGGQIDISATFTGNHSGRLPTGKRRFNVSVDTDVFLVGYNVTSGSSTGFGYISARRMR